MAAIGAAAAHPDTLTAGVTLVVAIWAVAVILAAGVIPAVAVMPGVVAIQEVAAGMADIDRRLIYSIFLKLRNDQVSPPTFALLMSHPP